MAEQLSFDLPVRVAQGRDDFFVSSANATAVAMVEGWQDWPARKLVLTGPQGAGKTHLVHVWSTLAGARVTSAAALPQADIPQLCRSAIAVENCDQIAGDGTAEAALFHLHNLALAEGRNLLLTARTAPNHWSLHLPDLASRMQATPTVAIDEPDDDLLSALLAKLFHDRQIVPQSGVIPYLVKRMDRSFKMAESLVDHLDRSALAQRTAVSVALARQALDKSQA